MSKNDAEIWKISSSYLFEIWVLFLQNEVERDEISSNTSIQKLNTSKTYTPIRQEIPVFPKIVEELTEIWQRGIPEQVSYPAHLYDTAKHR